MFGRRKKQEKEDSGVYFKVGGKGLRIKGLEKSAAHAISSAKDQEVRGDENAIRAFHKLQELHQDAGKLQKKADLLKDLKINASNKGFEIIDNEGGGNCMFHALCDQLKYKKGLEISHQELREKLVKYLQEHPKMSDGTELASFLDTHRFPSWAEYLQKMAKDEWGDHRILFAAANWSQCNIRVISSIPSHEVTMSPFHPNSDADVLVLGHVFELHYVSLRRPTSDYPSQVQEEAGDSRDWSLSSLGISDFKSDIDYFGKFYDADTRRWLFADFDRWFSDPGDSRAYVLLGDAGVGKSVIAAELVKLKRNNGSFGACYFCLGKDILRSDPRNLIGTVAYQLCKYNKEYNTKVGGENRVTTVLDNSALGLNALFTKLLQEPLGQCDTYSKRRLVIIDALDELNYKFRKDFLDLLLDRFPSLPKWLVFFITSRPEDTLQFNLKRYNPCIKICAGNGQDSDNYRKHNEDIRRFLEKKVKFSDLPYSVEDVVAKCNGMFLYAYYISQELSDRTSSIKGANLDDLFPGDIERFFLKNFDRICDKLGKDLYGKLFSCVVAAPSLLPFPFISFILKKENSDLDEQMVIDAVSRFVVVHTSDNTCWFLHNLIPSWLTSEKKALRKLFIDRGKASQYFKKIILTFFCGQLEGGVSVNSQVLHYLLHVGVRFLCCNYDNRDSMTTVFSCLTSFHFLQKRVNTDRLEIFAVVSDYKLCLQCQSLTDAEKLILQEICTALKKNIYVLVNCADLLRSCLRLTSETTQRKLAVSGDTLMTYKSLDWLPYVASTLSCKGSVFALSPDKKLLTQDNRNLGIARKYDACSLKEMPGLVDGRKDVDLSVDRVCVEEYWNKRNHPCSCLAYAFYLWAKLELSKNKDYHSEVIFSPKVRWLVIIAKAFEFMEGNCFPFISETEKVNDLQQLDSRLCSLLYDISRRCKANCVWYYLQEPSLTALIQWIAEKYDWVFFLQDIRHEVLAQSNLDFLTLRVIILILMAASSEFFSFSTTEWQHNWLVQSPNGKLIAFRDLLFLHLEVYTIEVFRNITETGEIGSFSDPVRVTKQVDAFSFTCSSDFVVYVQKEGRCFKALSLQTGSILSCDSGFSPVFHIIQSPQVGFVFYAGSEKSIVSLSDFLVSSELRRYLVLPVVTSTGSPSGITFTLGGNISYLSSNLMLCVVVRNGDGSFVTSAKCAPLEYPHGCKVENCALSRQGKSIAVSQKATILLFDNHEFHLTVFKESEDIECQVSGLIFSHDGSLLLYCVERRNSQAEVCLWNVDQEQLSSSFIASQLESINCCCLSPDNSMVILCGELRVEIWEDVLCSHKCLKMEKEVMKLYPRSERFHYCTVSSGNERLACCIADDVLLCSLWSPAEEPFYPLRRAHLGQIQFCQFLRETRYLISYGIDGQVFLWDLYEGKAVDFAIVAEGEEIIEGMSVSNMEDEVVCLISSGRVIRIKLHGLKKAKVSPPPLPHVMQISSVFGAGGGYLSREPEVHKLLEEMNFMASEDDSDVEERQV
ncbi:uncharacterized protein LOC114949750 [Acropora millepora]|uniref:uncharacterized protein LOC114949750 n=1 Tax=Acropora millepora TaxID=45264 RepID=UPI001CF1571A|nr:uncharacterized protein LOC114949750 [Acropora millepora]